MRNTVRRATLLTPSRNTPPEGHASVTSAGERFKHFQRAPPARKDRCVMVSGRAIGLPRDFQRALGITRPRYLREVDALFPFNGATDESPELVSFISINVRLKTIN